MKPHHCITAPPVNSNNPYRRAIGTFYIYHLLYSITIAKDTFCRHDLPNGYIGKFPPPHPVQLYQPTLLASKPPCQTLPLQNLITSMCQTYQNALHNQARVSNTYFLFFVLAVAKTKPHPICHTQGTYKDHGCTLSSVYLFLYPLGVCLSLLPSQENPHFSNYLFVYHSDARLFSPS